VIGHLEQLVQVGAESGDLRLELMDPPPVAHVLGEVVQAVHPVIEGAGDQEEGERHHRNGPERDPVDMENRPVDVHVGQVAVAEHGRRHPYEEADDQRAGQQKALPQMVQIGTGPKVNRFEAGSLPIDA